LDKRPAETPEMPISTSDMQQMLNLIAQCIDELEARLTNGQAFMSAEECPSEGSNQL
jgi:hypothetical protein